MVVGMLLPMMRRIMLLGGKLYYNANDDDDDYSEQEGDCKEDMMIAMRRMVVEMLTNQVIAGQVRCHRQGGGDVSCAARLGLLEQPLLHGLHNHRRDQQGSARREHQGVRHRARQGHAGQD